MGTFRYARVTSGMGTFMGAFVDHILLLPALCFIDAQSSCNSREPHPPTVLYYVAEASSGNLIQARSVRAVRWCVSTWWPTFGAMICTDSIPSTGREQWRLRKSLTFPSCGRVA